MSADVSVVEPQATPANSRHYGVYLVFLVVIAAAVPWRSKSYFSGSPDPVVLTKAALSILALGMALYVGYRRPIRPVAAAPLVFLSLYLSATVLGSLASSETVASIVVAIRVMIMAVTVIVLAQRFEGVELLGCLVAASATVGAIGAVTGLTDLSDGRLGGGVPPLHPNELASMSAVVVLWCLWKVTQGKDTAIDLVGIGVASVVLIATGSRTPALALAAGAVVLLLHARAVRMRSLIIALVVMPVMLWILTATNVVADLLFRNQGADQITTLSNRTIAWQAALTPKDSAWLEWLGSGLATKKIQVPGQWWNEQILDSSWVSALVQGGIIGLLICAIWIVYSLIRTIESPRDLRGLQAAFIVYLALRGLLESGLFDATTAFLLLFTTMMSTPVQRPAMTIPGARHLAAPDQLTSV